MPGSKSLLPPKKKPVAKTTYGLVSASGYRIVTQSGGALTVRY